MRNPLILAIAILDALFIFSYGIASGIIVERIQERAIAAIGVAGQIYPNIAQQLALNPSVLSILRENASIEQHFQVIINWVLVLMLAVFVLYNLFQGFSWKLTFKILQKKFSFKKFIGINCLWFSLFFIIQAFDFFRLLANSLTHGFDEAVALSSGSPLFITLYVTLAYFALISYPLLSKYSVRETIKRSVTIGITKMQKVLPIFVVIAVVFFLFDRLLLLTFEIRWLWIAIGVVTVATLSWARLLLITYTASKYS